MLICIDFHGKIVDMKCFGKERVRIMNATILIGSQSLSMEMEDPIL